MVFKEELQKYIYTCIYMLPSPCKEMKIQCKLKNLKF